MSQQLHGKTILVTGGAKRVGKILALACARAGADVVVHHGHSAEEAEATREEITSLGRQAWVIEADLSDPAQAGDLVPLINESTHLHGLVNSAAIPVSMRLSPV